MPSEKNGAQARPAASWRSIPAVACVGFLITATVTGLAIRFGPFHVINQWAVLIHTALGIVCLIPAVYYTAVHWREYRRQSLSDLVLLGYLSAAILALCLVSGGVVTWQALFSTKTSRIWRDLHLVTTLGLAGALSAHLVLSYLRA
ncbi:MAG: hypothetical protein IT364_04355, partial [Candidatus Hydrogenedentes bacterium]|nr:hypothetical protein [Candidatus Hydrogenedentota bacterium]